MLQRVLISALFCLSLLPAVARAQTPIVFSQSGAAISGYDPVAYFTIGAAVQGKEEFALVWKRAEWHFVSPENRDLFEANPRAYAPQYGGYCAYGVSRGGLSATDPKAWLIRDGRLFLVHNDSVRKVFAADTVGYVTGADANWPHVLRD